MTITSPSLNMSVASCPYGSVVSVAPRRDDMRYIALLALALMLAALDDNESNGNGSSLLEVSQ